MSELTVDLPDEAARSRARRAGAAVPASRSRSERHRGWPRPVSALPDLAPASRRWTPGRLALPLSAVLWAYPLWWALGISAAVWSIAALVMASWLITTRATVRVPPAFGWWLLFLAWVFLSALTLDSGGRAAAALYRGASYLAGTVFLLYVLNTGERLLPTRIVTRGLTALWGWSVGLGLVALAIPREQFTSLAERVLPGSLVAQPFVYALVHPRFASEDLLVHVPRPTPLFQYTNTWGSVVGLLFPVAVFAALSAPTRRARLLLWAAVAVSAVPVVVSINRGLWISIVVAVAYVLARRLARGDLRAAWAFLAAAAAAAVAVLATPLGTVINERLHASNTSTRQTLYAASVQEAVRSPVLGHGSPTSSAGLFDSNSVSVGTHGQFWTVLVSQGFPGAVFFVGALVGVAVATWRVTDRGLWLHAVLVVAVVQLPFYDLLPAGIAIWGAVVALCVRDVRGRTAPAPPGPTITFAGTRAPRTTAGATAAAAAPRPEEPDRWTPETWTATPGGVR